MTAASRMMASSLEKVALALERNPWAALYRISIGFLIVPAHSLLARKSVGQWGLFVFFLGVLFALRVGPAVLRGVLRFSDEARAVWYERRMMAKRYDSFQWRKLLWFGIGLLAYMAAFDRDAKTGGVLAVTCIACGLLGSIILKRRLVRAAATASQ